MTRRLLGTEEEERERQRKRKREKDKDKEKDNEREQIYNIRGKPSNKKMRKIERDRRLNGEGRKIKGIRSRKRERTKNVGSITNETKMVKTQESNRVWGRFNGTKRNVNKQISIIAIHFSKIIRK